MTMHVKTTRWNGWTFGMYASRYRLTVNFGPWEVQVTPGVPSLRLRAAGVAIVVALAIGVTAKVAEAKTPCDDAYNSYMNAKNNLASMQAILAHDTADANNNVCQNNTDCWDELTAAIDDDVYWVQYWAGQVQTWAQAGALLHCSWA